MMTWDGDAGSWQVKALWACLMWRVAAAVSQEPLGTGALASLSWSAIASGLRCPLASAGSGFMTRPHFFPAFS